MEARPDNSLIAPLFSGKLIRNRGWLPAFWSIAMLLLAFIYGLAVGQYRLWPRQHIVDAHSYLFEAPPRKAAWFDEAFADPVIPGPKIFPAITNEAGVHAANEMMFMRVGEYGSSYEKLVLGEAKLIALAKRQVLQVPFEYQDRRFTAWAYAPKGLKCGGDRTSVLMIPGTGYNVSTAMLDANAGSENYEGINVLLRHANDAFIFVKPNEDFLAYHNGFGRKLGTNYTVNYHLNLGGSYAASYLVHAAAIIKYLKRCHNRVGVAGYSQGGAASLLLGLLTQPDFAIVASGHSIIHNDIPISGQDQISGLVEYGRLNRKAELQMAISQSPKTRFLFTWGRNDSSSYQQETITQPTITALQALSNVETIIHRDGHILPGPTMREFLEKNGYPAVRSGALERK